MAKWKPGPESDTPTLLKYFYILSLDTPDNRTEEESPLSSVCSHSRPVASLLSRGVLKFDLLLLLLLLESYLTWGDL